MARYSPDRTSHQCRSGDLVGVLALPLVREGASTASSHAGGDSDLRGANHHAPVLSTRAVATPPAPLDLLARLARARGRLRCTPALSGPQKRARLARDKAQPFEVRRCDHPRRAGGEPAVLRAP